MKNLVTAALLTSSLTPGEPGWLAVEYTITDGWHIYWENPGDTGIPTEVSLTLPPGVQAEAPRYPGPHRFMMPGDLVNYGYAHKATLMIPVQADAWGGTIAADTRWLVCREEQCVPGKTHLTIDLSAAPAVDVSAALAALPGPLPATATVTRAAQALSVTLPGARQIEVFPNLTLEAAGLTVKTTGERADLTLKTAAAAGAEVVLRVVAADGAEHFYRLPLSG